MTFPAPYRARGATTSTPWSRSLRPVIGPTSSSSTSLGRDRCRLGGSAVRLRARYGRRRDSRRRDRGAWPVLAHDATAQIFAMGTVHPEHAGRGLGSARSTSRRRAALRLPAGVSAPFARATPATDAAARQLFVEHGYRVVRCSGTCNVDCRSTMRPSLFPTASRCGSVGRTATRPSRTGSSTRRSATISATSPRTRRWLQEFRGMPGYDPSLIVLAFEGEEPVGASVNLAADDGVGWVGDLGVREAWRRRGAGKGVARLIVRGTRRTRAPRGAAGRGHRERDGRDRPVRGDRHDGSTAT